MLKTINGAKWLEYEKIEHQTDSSRGKQTATMQSVEFIHPKKLSIFALPAFGRSNARTFCSPTKTKPVHILFLSFVTFVYIYISFIRFKTV